MPTNLRRTSQFAEGDISVLYSENGLRSPRMRTIDLTKIQADADGNKILRSGTIIVKSGEYGRPLPAAKIATAITTASTSIVVDNAGNFTNGEALVVTRPYARLDLALVWADNDTATVTLDGNPIIHTVTGFTTLTALAVAIAATLNGNSTFSSKATAIPENQYIHLFGKDGRNYAIAVAENTAGTGTLTIADSVTSLQSGVTVGTLAAANAVNVATNTLTLAAAAARRLPADAPIGVAIAPSDVVGMVLTTQLLSGGIDLTPVSNDVACYTSASVFGARLPVWDEWLQRALPEITLV